MNEKKTIPDDRLAAAGKLTYRVDEACHALGIGRTSLYELVKSGELKLIKIAGRTLIPRSELERLASVERIACSNTAAPAVTGSGGKISHRHR